MTPDLTSKLRSVGIGCNLPRKRYKRKKDPNILKVHNLNCQSCRNKATDIHDLVLEKSADVLILTETWMRQQGDEAITTCMTPAGYHCYSFPRPCGRGGGGIAFIIRSSLSPFVSFKSLDYQTFESVEMRLTLKGTATTCVAVYRPPPNKKNKFTVSGFLREFPDLLSSYVHSPSDVFLLGDFNFHFEDKADCSVRKIEGLFKEFGLCQLVKSPTQKCGHTLDWVVVRSDKSLLTLKTVLDCDISDHSLITCKLDLSRPPPPTRLVTSRNLKAISLPDFQADVKALAGSMAAQGQDGDVESLVSAYNDRLQQILDHHAPVATRRVRDRPSAPWVTEEVREARRRRRRAERQWRKTRLTVHRQIFKNERENVRLSVQDAKKLHYKHKIDSAASSSKLLFSMTNELLGKKKLTVLPSDSPRDQLPQRFCDFFADKIKQIRTDIDSCPCEQPSFSTYEGRPFCTFKPVSEKEVLRVIMQSPTKSSMLDPIPTSLTKQCINDIVPMITSIVNASLSTGRVPMAFKQAVVTPLLKKTGLDKNVLKNYRPISNLSFVSKVLEKIVLSQLQEHLKENHLLEVFQSAYRKDHSVETAVLSVLDGLLVSSDKHQVSLMALLDLSAAFDTLDHSILLKRLELTFGIHETVLKWFASFVQNRQQCVIVDGVRSPPAPLVYGVPQGSVLGPVLFSLYSQPLSDVIVTHSCNYHKYADDTKLSKSAPPNDFLTVERSLQNCISDVLIWMNSNRLKLNAAKTEVIPVGYPTYLDLVDSDSLDIGDTTIHHQASVKYLGIWIDSSLSMKDQVSNVCRACFLELRRIASIRPYLSNTLCIRLVIALVTSRLDSCNSIYIGIPQAQIEKLQRVQNCAARLITGTRKHDHITPVLKDLHWLPVKQRIDYKVAVLAFRHFEGTLPVYLSNTLSTYHPRRSLRSVAQKILTIPKRNMKSVGERSFSFYAPTVWNSLPTELRNVSTLASFKSGLKTFLFRQAFA